MLKNKWHKNIFFYCIFFFLINLFFLSKNWTFDSLGFSLTIRDNDWQHIFHPYHLIYTFIWYSLHKIININILLLGQIISLFFGSVSVYLFYKILDYISENKKNVFLLTIFFSLTYWHWYYSVDAELHTLNLSTILLFNFLLLKYKTKKDFFILSFISGLSVLIHQINVFLPFLFFLILIYKKQYKYILYHFIILFFVILIPYIFVFYFINKFFSLIEFYKWLTKYQQIGYWNNITQNYYKEAFKGLSFALWGGGKLKYYLTQIMIFIIGIYSILNFKKIIRDLNRIIIYSITLFYAAVVIYWHPANPENWYALYGIIILLSFLLEKIYKIYYVLFISVFIMLIFVGKPYIYKTSILKNNRYYKIVENIRKTDKMFVCLGVGEYENLNIYIPYFNLNNAVSIAVLLHKNKSNLETTKLELIKSLKNKQKIFFKDLNNLEEIKVLAKMHKLEYSKLLSFINNLKK